VQQAIAALPPGAVKTHRQLASLEYIDMAATRELDMLVARPPMRRLALRYPRRSCSAPPAVLVPGPGEDGHRRCRPKAPGLRAPGPGALPAAKTPRRPAQEARCAGIAHDYL
jgi:hypothetical protein